MSKKTTINVKERYTDGEIDLSLSNLSEVPVKEITNFPKTVSLDLSNNILKTLPNNFPSLTFLLKLDLSKNELRELPKNFGDLVKLRHLDLYQNKLEKLPISFGRLTNLKFLDLKGNPLNAATAKVAGPCTDNKGCQQCARDIVKYFSKLFMEEERNKKVQEERQQLLQHQQQQRAREEKKKLKKERQMKKIVKPAPVEPQFVPKKETTVNKLKEKPKSGRLWNLLLFFVIFLWFSFALNLPFTKPFVPSIKNIYTVSLNKLPEEYQSYGHYVGQSVSVLQDGTRNISQRCIEAVSNSDLFQSFIANVRSFY